jgi:hypothetical protein
MLPGRACRLFGDTRMPFSCVGGSAGWDALSGGPVAAGWATLNPDRLLVGNKLWSSEDGQAVVLDFNGWALQE